MKNGSFRSDGGGNVAIMGALLIPVASVFAAAAVELAFVWRDDHQLQAAADSAALGAAHELALASTDGLTARAEALALAQAQDLQQRGTVSATAEIIENGGAIRVAMVANRPSFFGNLVPPGGFTTRAEAVAAGMGRTPLCVLVNGTTPGDKVLRLLDRSVLRAPGCLVHSNEDISVEASGSLTAGAVQSVGPVVGKVTPEAEVGAEPIEDPFAGQSLGPQGICVDLPGLVLRVSRSLPAARHCKKITVERNAQLTLLPGTHYFQDADLVMKENSKLVGEDVVLVFDRESTFEFSDNTAVSLYGQKSGPMAGFLIATTRDNRQDFIMSTDHVRTLEGVVYIPNAKLIVQGTGDVAEESAWTVVVADRVELKGSPTLVINKDYGASDVPVPAAVASSVTEVRLAK